VARRWCAGGEAGHVTREGAGARAALEPEAGVAARGERDDERKCEQSFFIIIKSHSKDPEGTQPTCRRTYYSLERSRGKSAEGTGPTCWRTILPSHSLGSGPPDRGSDGLRFRADVAHYFVKHCFQL
jgi:hypothetical protein